MDQIEIKARALEIAKVFYEKSGNIFSGEKEKAFLEEWTKRLAEREASLIEAKDTNDPEVIELNKEAFNRMLGQVDNIANMFQLTKEKEWLEMVADLSKKALSTAAKMLLGFG